MVTRKTDNTKELPKRDINRVKQSLWAEFEKQSEAVLTLAYMYARGYDLAGEDVTKAWTNAVRNNQIIEEVYRKGYEDALKDVEAKKRRDFHNKTIVDVKGDRK